jgi:hypothetical protein
MRATSGDIVKPKPMIRNEFLLWFPLSPPGGVGVDDITDQYFWHGGILHGSEYLV